MDKENFMADAKKKRKENMQSVILEVLAKMLKGNVRYLDTHYIKDRTQEILENTVKKLKFSNEEIRKARRAFLDVLLDGAKKELFGFKDDEKIAKTDIKAKGQRKELGKEVLRSLERMEKGLPKGLTEQRNMECEPICQLIASKLFSKELLLKDANFVDGQIEFDDEILINTLSGFASQELFDGLIESLDKSYMTANEVNWGCRRDEIRLQNIDTRIKK